MPGVFSEVECRRVNWGKDRKEGGVLKQSQLYQGHKDAPSHSWIQLDFNELHLMTPVIKC